MISTKCISNISSVVWIAVKTVKFASVLKDQIWTMDSPKEKVVSILRQLSGDPMDEKNMNEKEEQDLDAFGAEIQKATKYLMEKEETKQAEPVDSIYDSTNTNEPSPSPPEPASISPQSPDSFELSVTYSAISGENEYIHGAAFSSPRATFHADSAMESVVKIHDLLIKKDNSLFFIVDPDDDSDIDTPLNSEELSEERKQSEYQTQLTVSLSVHAPVPSASAGSETNPTSPSTSSRTSRKRKRGKTAKLKRVKSDRGNTFAIK